MLKRILTLFAVICIIVIFKAGFISYAAPVSNVQEARKGVVMVYCEDPKDSNSGSMGSGFVIGKRGSNSRYIVTSFHVIADNINGVSVVISSDVFIKAKPIITNTVGDFAVLELEKELNDRIPLPLEVNKNVSVAQKIYALGFPGAASQIEDINTWTPEDVTVSSGIISKELTVDGIGTYQVDASINPGNSGGPLITEDGAVIGIARFTTKDATNINGAVKIDEIIPSLDSYKIPYELYSLQSGSNVNENSPEPSPTESTVDDSSSTGSGLPTAETNSSDSSDKLFDYNWTYILIGLAALVVIVMIIIILSSGKNKNKPKSKDASKQPETVKDDSPQKRIHPYEDRQVTVPQYAPRKQMGVYCTSGIYSNQFFSLSSGKLTIGRDYNFCNIVYPADTPGISAVHCEISYNPSMNKCMLVDKGSTYGTFLSNGERLAQGKVYYLNISDSFYLASTENIFEIREN